MASTKAHTRYRLQSGEIIPGVTTIIDSSLGWNKRALISWARRESLDGRDPEKILIETGDEGTAAHLLIAGFIEGTEPYLGTFTQEQIDAGNKALLAFKSWCGGRDLDFRHVEYRVISERHKFGGTIDLIVVLGGLLLLLDLKTSKSLYPEHIVQVSAYGQAYQEQAGETIGEYHLLRLSKEGSGFSHHVLTPAQVSAGWEVFLHCRALYDLKKELII